MTAQIDDGFRYRGREYAVAGISEGELFEPALLELKPVWRCTACWRGYRAVFALADNRLVLDCLHINLEKPGDRHEGEVGPIINAVQPVGPQGEHDWFNNHYDGLQYHLEYTGGLLLADGFIRELYIHMGFHPAWKYERVVELVFDAGILRQEFDQSEAMAEIRQCLADEQFGSESQSMPTREEIARFVEQAFDRKYRL